MRTPLVVGNWKMHRTVAESVALAGAVADGGLPGGVEAAVCPTFLALAAVRERLSGSRLGLGAQDCLWPDEGAFTGRVSARMLASEAVRYVVVGHSETRGRFGGNQVSPSVAATFADTDETVRLKLQAVVHHGMTPVLCVGETDDEREAGRTDEVVTRQVVAALAGVEAKSLAVAYEPVWAIGTGKTCPADEAQRVCALIRDTLGAERGDGTHVLYGGSVKPDNAAELFGQPDVDGGLVGGASLEAESFLAIVRAAAQR